MSFGRRLRGLLLHGETVCLREIDSCERDLSYSKFLDLCNLFGSGLVSNYQQPLAVGLCLTNSIEYAICDVGCAMHGIPTVSITNPHCNLSDVQKLKVLVTSSSTVESPLWIKMIQNINSLETIILTNDESNKISEMPPNKKYNILPISAMLENSKSLVTDPPEFTGEDDQIFTYFMTSGSTGVPSLIPVTRARWNASRKMFAPAPQSICYQPLGYIAERSQFWNTLLSGGNTTLVSQFDFALLAKAHPTVLFGAPHFFRKLVEFCRLFDDPNELRHALGGRLRTLVSGGGHLDASTLEFLSNPNGPNCTIYNGYGTTETGNIAMNRVVLPGVQLRLQNWKDFDAHTIQGELLVKTPEINEWHSTGDVVQLTSPASNIAINNDSGEICTGDGFHLEIQVVGRQKFGTKLANGEMILLDFIDSQLVSPALFEWIFVWAEAGWEFPVACVSGCDRNTSPADLLLQLREWALRNTSVRPFEIPKTLLVAKEPFSQENNQITISGKLNRTEVAAIYKEQLRELYYAQLRRAENGAPLTSESQCSRLWWDCLDIADAAQKLRTVSFRNLGGTSLAASLFLVKLRKAGVISGADPLSPVDILLPHCTLDYLEQRIYSPTSENVFSHSRPDYHEIKSLSQLTCKDKDFLAQFVSSSQHQNRKIQNIVITGASGFIGKALIDHLCATYPAYNLFCISRNPPSCAGSCDRVHWMAGDVSKAQFGLGKDYLSLLEKADVLIHAAANVNLVVPWQELCATNIEGTRNALHFACESGAKLVHISTSDVNSVRMWMQNCGIEALESAETRKRTLSGYAITKWAAEELLSHAAQINSHLSISVVELPFIYGNPHPTDLFCASVRALLDAGSYPVEFENAPLLKGIHIYTAVEFITSVMHNSTSNGRLVAPAKEQLILKELVTAIVRCTGLKLQPVNYHEWVDLDKHTIRTSQELPFPLIRAKSDIGKDLVLSNPPHWLELAVNSVCKK